jgi:hypothetical protein
MCEPVFDTLNKKVSFYNKRGKDKGVYFLKGLNLKKLQKKSTTYDYYTRIIPVGADGLTIESVNDGKNYLENYQYTDKILTYIWKDESYTNAEALKEDAELLLEDLSKPEKSYSAEIRDLASQKEEYKILSYELGDTIKIIDRESATMESQRIVKITEYPQNPEKNTCELANTVLTFEEMQQKVQEAAEIINYTIASDGRYSGTINVSDILHFEDGLSSSTTIGGMQDSINGIPSLIMGQVEANYVKTEEADIKYANIENLNVLKETVESLSGDYGDFKNLNAQNFSAVEGYIDTFSSNFSDIKTLLLGNGIAGDFSTIHLTSANSVIESALIKDAVMQTVTVNDLLAGDILTNRFRIISEDGGIQISGSTQQWKDADGVVRIQIGRDANDDFTFSLFDATGKGVLIDATGVKPDAIADGLIVDQMVSDDANISASKLDIASMFRAINDSEEVLYASRIWFDEEGQSLNQLYAQMAQKMVDISDGADQTNNELSSVKDVVESTVDHVSELDTSVSGLSQRISDTQSDLYGLSDGTLLYNVKYKDNEDGTTTLTAYVYKAGKDVTKEYPATWFCWKKKSESGASYIGQGYSITVNNEDSDLGGTTYIGIFIIKERIGILTKNGKRILTKSRKQIMAEIG